MKGWSHHRNWPWQVEGQNGTLGHSGKFLESFLRSAVLIHFFAYFQTRECHKKVKFPPSGNCRAAHLSIFSIAPFKRFSKDFQKICPRPPPGRGSANRGDILHQEIQFCFQKLHFTQSTYLLTRHLEVKGQYWFWRFQGLKYLQNFSVMPWKL